DYFVLKPKHSGFFDTTLDTLLGALKIRRVIVTGIAGNICVLFTANDAYMRDPWTTQRGIEDMKTELDKFYGLIEVIKVAMMTTRRPDGHLESRAMANQRQAAGADLWFVTAEGTGKLRDIAHDPHVNLAYYKTGSYEWGSALGVARVSKDRATIRELYEPDWKAWFGGGGHTRHGTGGDPRIGLSGRGGRG